MTVFAAARRGDADQVRCLLRTLDPDEVREIRLAAELLAAEAKTTGRALLVEMMQRLGPHSLHDTGRDIRTSDTGGG